MRKKEKTSLIKEASNNDVVRIDRFIFSVKKYLYINIQFRCNFELQAHVHCFIENTAFNGYDRSCHELEIINLQRVRNIFLKSINGDSRRNFKEKGMN